MKNILTVSALLAVSFGIYAAPISPEAAIARAQGNGPERIGAQGETGVQLVYTVRTTDGTPVAYVFNRNEGGFRILAADDSAYPVLGYSDQGRVDPANMPVQLKWLLEEYGRQIAFSAGAPVEKGRSYAPAGLTAVQPLMTTTWNQDAPYNQMTPVVAGVQSPTGCVATSFAQVMNYHQYPEVGQGKLSYSDDGVKRNINFGLVPFDWNNMLDSYSSGGYTQEQADAVAYLMKACGYAVQMDYGRDASGALSYRLMNAAVEYFKYDQGIRYQDRILYSADQWMRMLHANIADNCPVICDGRSIDGGHSFVMDGYDGNGYFHLNWGWGGMSNGYFLVDALNPDSQGIGGAAGGFNYSQSALFNMKKPDGTTPEPWWQNARIYGTATAAMEGDNVLFSLTGSASAGYTNATYNTDKVYVGAILMDQAGNAVREIQGKIISTNGGEMTMLTLNYGSYYSAANLRLQVECPGDLADGVYKLVMAARQSSDEAAPWQPMQCDWGNANYCWLTVQDGNCSVSDESAKRLEFSECEFTTPTYIGRNCRMEAKVANNSDLQLTAQFTPVLLRDGIKQYVGDMMLVTVDPGQIDEESWFIQFFQANGATNTGTGTYTLGLMDVATGAIIGTYGDYDFTTVGSGYTLELQGIGVVDTPTKNITVGSRTFKDAFEVADASAFEIFLNYKVATGYFDSSMRMVLSRYDRETSKFVTQEGDIYFDRPFLGRGEEAQVIVPMNFTDMDLATVYQVRAAYNLNGANKQIGSLYFGFDTSAVEDLEPDSEDAAPVFYNLQGMRIEQPAKGELLIRVRGSKVEKVIIE